MYRIENFSNVSKKTIKKALKFISANSFNNGISFLDHDMNYYENFKWLYFLYENDSLISVLSIFVPDSASCEIYFHVLDDKINVAQSIFTHIYENVKIQLSKYDINNVYFLWNCCKDIAFDNIFSDLSRYNHSEYLMKYDLNYCFDFLGIRLSFDVIENENGIRIETFFEEENVGICNIDAEDSYALIYGVEISQTKRGLGFGRETLFITLNYLIKNDYTDILLHVNSANTAAYTLYSHHGFNVIQQIDYWKLI